MIFYDTETCGFYGPIVLLQYAQDDGEIKLHCPWDEKVKTTISLIEWIISQPVCGFNLAFDHFHLCQMYTVLLLLRDSGFGDYVLEDCIENYAGLETLGRDGPALKPVAACDILLHARKGPYQSTMDRKDIRIRRVPTPLAFQLAQELDSRIKLKDIYFARKKNKKWQVYDVKDSEGRNVSGFKDVVLKFAASAALKALAVDALGVREDLILKFRDINVDKAFNPVEHGFAPFAQAVGCKDDWKGAWPDVIRQHISHWKYNELAREYAAKDVEYTRRLWHFFGCPEPGDDDSELACCIAAARWKGYKINAEGIRILIKACLARKKTVVDGKLIKIPTAPKQVKHWVLSQLDPTEREACGNSTKKMILEKISKLTRPCSCCPPAELNLSDDLTFEQQMEIMLNPPPVKGRPDCEICHGGGLIEHPAAKRASLVLDARTADKEREVYDKLLLAGRFHASFNIIGALSSRMSGADKLNPQGIKKSKEVRSQFPLAFDGSILCGGDFSGFEVTIAEAIYNDPGLRTALKSKRPCHKCKGVGCKECDNTGQVSVKIHALFGVNFFPHLTYDEIMEGQDTSLSPYDRSKKGIFSLFYGGEVFTLMDRLNISRDAAEDGLKRFHNQFPGVKQFQKQIDTDFCSMRQVGGLGTKVVWIDPAEKIESMFGFPRYYTLENQICKALFELANKPPKSWKDIKIKVFRRDREQFASGAVQSALYGAAFQIQAANKRSATNHVIQSSGAQITKALQRKIWDLQPVGVHPWIVQPMNIHDEILTPVHPDYLNAVKERVDTTVESFRGKVPLIKMSWKIGLVNWAEKD